MFRRWKRLVAVIAAATLPVLAALWSAIFSKLATAGIAGGAYSYFPYAYVGLICIVSIGSAYVTHPKSASDLHKPLLSLLNLLSENPLRIGEQLKINPRMNLMVVERRWFVFERKRIRIVWSRKMNGFPDVRFRCLVDQGIAGQALKNGRPVLADCEAANKAVLNFTSKQLADTNHVTSVWSWPIYEVDKGGQQTGTMIGVLSLDSTQPGSFAKLQQSSAKFEESMQRFTEIASTIL